MVKNVIYITPELIYAIRVTESPEFWRVAWTKATWEPTLQDVIDTLSTHEFHVVLSSDLLPPNDSEQDLTPAYTEALTQAGCHILSIQTVDNLSVEDVTAMFPATPTHHSELHLGSLEDLREPTPHKSGSALKLTLVALIAVLFATGAWFLWSGTLLGGGNMTPTTSTSPLPTPTPTPTPAPSVIVPSPQNQDFVIQIQNGTGTPGLAGKFSAKLEAEGFVIKDVGNANNYNYAHAVLKAKATVPATIKQTVQGVLTDSAWVDSTLDAASSYDMIVIIGKGSSLSN